MGLLKTLFFIILFYYSFKLIARVLAPFLLSYFFKKAQNNFHSHNEEDIKSEGEVSIKYKPSEDKDNPSTNDQGEYVDYEEMD